MMLDYRKAVLDSLANLADTNEEYVRVPTVLLQQAVALIEHYRGLIPPDPELPTGG